MRYLLQLSLACLTITWFAYADTVPVPKPGEKVKVEVPAPVKMETPIKAAESENQDSTEAVADESPDADAEAEAEDSSEVTAEDTAEEASEVAVEDSSSEDVTDEVMQESLKEMNEQSHPLANMEAHPVAKGDSAITLETRKLDSLGITTDSVVSTPDGGTRRVSLQRSVFHREEPFVYASGGHRDPFRALIVDEKKEGEIQTDLLRMEGASLAGVVWSQGTYLAIVRDAEGQSFFLREGDPVFSGRLVTVTETQASFEMNEFGDYQRVTLKVVPKVVKRDKG